MSSSSTRSSRRRSAAQQDNASGDLFATGTPPVSDPVTQSSTTSGRRRTRGRAGEPDQPADHTSTDLRSGLRTSEVEMNSALSYSGDMSSVSGATIPTRDQPSSLRAGVNDETARRAVAMPHHNADDTGSAPEAVIWGTDVNIAHVMTQFKQFITTFIPSDWSGLPQLATGQPLDPLRPLYLQRLDDLVSTSASSAGNPFMDVDLEHLRQHRPDLAQQLMSFPKEVIPACDAVVHALFVERCRGQPIERNVQIRPFNCLRSRNLRNLDPDDLDQLVTVTGLVIRLSALIPEMLRAEFKCAVCGASTTVQCERGNIAEPEACSRCHSAYTAQLQHNRCVFIDKQLIKLQESPEDMPASQTPHTVQMYAHEELVDKVQPGDRIIVTGVYRAAPLRTSNRQRTLKAVYKTYIDVLHFARPCDSSEAARQDAAVEESNNNEDALLKHFTQERIDQLKALSRKPDLYERLTAAVAPTIYENEDVKKGILMQLFGGSRKDFTDKGRGAFRADVNILLCGDPGTSKSQLLQYVYRVTPRGQYTSGKGSSAVGLTAYVARDPETRQLTLQTGALVLADNGICCIDEMDKMSDQTRSVLHEVMEQQTLSLAKAGILCQLHARTSVLAAANPVASKWDPQRTIIDNIQLPHTLLSRFDLIFLILDPQDEVYDARLARHLVSLYYKETMGTRKKDTSLRPGVVSMAINTEDDAEASSVDMNLLRDYIAYAKLKYNPSLTEEAGEYLIREYVDMRKLGSGRGQITAYPRQLESLVRLGEAHAKMRLSNSVSADDCREARRLQREALKQAAIDPVTGTIDVNILTTGVSSSMRKRREEMAGAIWTLLDERPRVLTFIYSRVLEELRTRSERMITRENFEDGLTMLKNSNKIDWAGNTIRKR